jgi:fatty acid desaturase
MASEEIQRIVKSIKQEEQRVRQQYSILAYQNSIGMLIFLLSLSGMLTAGTLYYGQIIPAWLCIVVIALSTSFAHEIEHDLIHRQYFNKQPMVYHSMMLIVWLMRPNTVNPWYRRGIHLQHHKFSGTKNDLEERLVGNGVVNLFLRFIVICDGLIGLILRRKQFKQEIKKFSFLTVLNAGFPLVFAYYLGLYSFLVLHGIQYFYQGGIDYPAWLITSMYWLDFIMVVFIAPNFIRSFSLNIITSSMHYYGGVNHLLQQTQVLTSWLFIPFQVFCCNFGGSHSIHHFVPNQPFYIRQMISKNVHKVMRKNGMRFNDLSSILQANYYNAKNQ